VKYFVTVNGAEHEVELSERLGELVVRYDGAPLQVRYEEVDRLGQVALHVGERAYAVSIEGDSSSANVTVAGHLYEVEIEDERERAAHRAERGGTSRTGQVKSVMPGVVVKLLVSAGESVAKGQPLLILEAMKMQNEILAPHAGRLDGVHVREGQAVTSGAHLLTLGPDEPGPAGA
jgi:biotin carboxyl carrier protein